MRADRLISMVLLLRQRGRLSAEVLAQELEVSVRTVQRDVEALSAAGVPVYAERGRHGGYALLPGFRTELTGLHHDEALALLTAGTGRADQVFGLGQALSSAVRKVVDALPDQQRASAHDVSARFLIEPGVDLLSRPQRGEDLPATVMVEVRRAVLAGRKLRIHYTAANREPRWRTVDPIGLVTVRDKGYLLALSGGADRTYRLSRIGQAIALTEPAERPEAVDLERIWRDHGQRFRAGDEQVVVRLRLDPARREELFATAVAVHADTVDTDDTDDTDGRLDLEVSFQDLRHAEWALWQLGLDAEILGPDTLRAAVRHRAAALAAHHT